MTVREIDGAMACRRSSDIRGTESMTAVIRTMREMEEAQVPTGEHDGQPCTGQELRENKLLLARLTDDVSAQSAH